MVVLVGVGHFGFVLFAKASKPIWPAPATSIRFLAFLRCGLRYASAYAPKAQKSELQKACYTGPLIKIRQRSAQP
jgi:hypothetical protein